jgi:hypothetical protein
MKHTYYVSEYFDHSKNEVRYTLSEGEKGNRKVLIDSPVTSSIFHKLVAVNGGIFVVESNDIGISELQTNQ